MNLAQKGFLSRIQLSTTQKATETLITSRFPLPIKKRETGLEHFRRLQAHVKEGRKHTV